MDSDNQEVRDLILLAMLDHVAFDGFTDLALQAGVRDLEKIEGMKEQLGPMPGERAFPGGLSDIARHFSGWADRRMISELEKLDMKEMRIRDRIAAGVRVRLQVLAPYKEAVRRLMTFLSVPQNAGLAFSCGFDTLNEIWYAAGDDSADFNFYTKRGLLAPVLLSTTLYWLADEGDDEGDTPDTWDFLDRRIDDILKIPSLKAKALSGIPKFSSPQEIYKRFSSAFQARR